VLHIKDHVHLAAGRHHGVLTIKLEASDFLAAANLDSKQSRRATPTTSRVRHWLRVTVAIVFILVFFTLFGSLLPRPAIKMSSFATGVLVGVYATLICLVIGAFYLYYFEGPRRVGRAYKRNKSLQQPLRMTWSDAGIVFENEHRWEKLNWADVLKWKEGEGLFLLYRATDQYYYIIPQRAFSDVETLVSFRSALQAHVGS